MQNDVLKNEIAPWQEKGRWYHGVVNADKSFDTNKTDKTLLDYFLVDSLSGEFMLIQTGSSYTTGNKFYILDVKSKLSDDATFSTSGAQARYDYFYTSGRKGFYISKALTTGAVEIWAFLAK